MRYPLNESAPEERLFPAGNVMIDTVKSWAENVDHHIYRDPRFVLKAAVYQDPTTDEIILQTENLKKYSWNESLRETYIKKGYLDP